MNPKKLITIALVAFVVISAGVLVFKNFSGAGAASAEAEITGTKIVAFYFHGTQRCPTCLKIERYSRAVVDSVFADQVSKGKLEFVPLNYDEPQLQHYYTDYQLSSQSLVLAHYRDGVQQKWENLQQIWDLVGDQQQFYAYVGDGVERFLKELD